MTAGQLTTEWDDLSHQFPEAAEARRAISGTFWKALTDDLKARSDYGTDLDRETILTAFVDLVLEEWNDGNCKLYDVDGFFVRAQKSARNSYSQHFKTIRKYAPKMKAGTGALGEFGKEARDWSHKLAEAKYAPYLRLRGQIGSVFQSNTDALNPDNIDLAVGYIRDVMDPLIWVSFQFRHQAKTVVRQYVDELLAPYHAKYAMAELQANKSKAPNRADKFLDPETMFIINNQDVLFYKYPLWDKDIDSMMNHVESWIAQEISRHHASIAGFVHQACSNQMEDLNKVIRQAMVDVVGQRQFETDAYETRLDELLKEGIEPVGKRDDRKRTDFSTLGWGLLLQDQLLTKDQRELCKDAAHSLIDIMAVTVEKIRSEKTVGRVTEVSADGAGGRDSAANDASTSPGDNLVSGGYIELQDDGWASMVNTNSRSKTILSENYDILFDRLNRVYKMTLWKMSHGLGAHVAVDNAKQAIPTAATFTEQLTDLVAARATFDKVDVLHLDQRDQISQEDGTGNEKDSEKGSGKGSSVTGANFLIDELSLHFLRSSWKHLSNSRDRFWKKTGEYRDNINTNYLGDDYSSKLDAELSRVPSLVKMLGRVFEASVGPAHRVGAFITWESIVAHLFIMYWMRVEFSDKELNDPDAPSVYVHTVTVSVDDAVAGVGWGMNEEKYPVPKEIDMRPYLKLGQDLFGTDGGRVKFRDAYDRKAKTANDESSSIIADKFYKVVDALVQCRAEAQNNSADSPATDSADTAVADTVTTEAASGHPTPIYGSYDADLVHRMGAVAEDIDTDFTSFVNTVVTTLSAPGSTHDHNYHVPGRLTDPNDGISYKRYRSPDRRTFDYDLGDDSAYSRSGARARQTRETGWVRSRLFHTTDAIISWQALCQRDQNFGTIPIADHGFLDHLISVGRTIGDYLKLGKKRADEDAEALATIIHDNYLVTLFPTFAARVKQSTTNIEMKGKWS